MLQLDGLLCLVTETERVIRDNNNMLTSEDRISKHSGHLVADVRNQTYLFSLQRTQADNRHLPDTKVLNVSNKYIVQRLCQIVNIYSQCPFFSMLSFLWHCVVSEHLYSVKDLLLIVHLHVSKQGQCVNDTYIKLFYFDIKMAMITTVYSPGEFKWHFSQL